MKISGFSMAKNAAKLYYPVKESVLSILPIVDEFIFVLGDCDSDDNTRELLESIDSEKIKIIDTVWDIQKYINRTIYAQQTDIAKSNCSGDWLFYIQADEVVHEKYLSVIKSNCEKFLDDEEVEGFLFKYIHFWGDYNHHRDAHGWYKNEIRIIRNLPEIHSWRDAQSFRNMPDFSKEMYMQKEGTNKIKVVNSGAYIYHYGWVRPPILMNSKKVAFNSHKGSEADKSNSNENVDFDYGPLRKLPEFKESHPKVMASKLQDFHWKDFLNYEKSNKYHHDKIKDRLITFFEKIFNKPLFEFKNYILLKRK